MTGPLEGIVVVELAVAMPILRHRLILTYEAAADGVTPEQVVAEVVKKVAVP